MLTGPLRQSIFAGVAALGAIGLALALVGLGLPFVLAALVAAWAAGLAQYAALRTAAPVAPVPPVAVPTTPPVEALVQQLDDYRRHTAALRHDLRGVLSPALMMSDRLIKHPDAAVQRAGNAVVRSIDRATALLAESKDLMTPEGTVIPTPIQPPVQAAATTNEPAGPAVPAR
jgi:hypothetical protein